MSWETVRHSFYYQDELIDDLQPVQEGDNRGWRAPETCSGSPFLTQLDQ
ncbi:hypothetical protein [Pararhizobium polonicum]|nr:hypothetical protein [Pararhizobium polonicum]